jgi:CubicO group peptidase (beta-lactamase class C family)
MLSDMRTRRRSAMLAGLVAALVAACSSGSSGSSPTSAVEDPAAGGTTVESASTYPGEAWSRRDPADAGFDPAALEALAAEAEAGGANCLVVTRHGRLVAEWYWNGTDATTAQETFSVTKSVTSTLVGLAQAEGALDLQDRAALYVPEWAGTPSAEVTVENLLRNDSGRHWDLATDYQALVAAEDRTAFAVGLMQDAAPGSTWAYNNAAIQTLDAVLAAATDQDPADYAEERLFAPLGMTRTEMSHDAAGRTTTFAGLRSTCRDLARFGHLYLRGGRWDGTQVVPEAWVEAATSRPSQELNAGYGYLWWVNHPGPIAGPLHITSEQSAAADGQMAPGAPQDMYWARGLGGQVVQVDPGSDTVVVRLGAGDRSSTYSQADTARVVTDALVAP